MTVAAHPAFAVICKYALRCPSTDAFVGEGSHVVARFDTHEKAAAYVKEQYNGRGEDYDDGEGCRFFVKMCPYREGEDVPKRPRYSVPELVADHYAHQRDLGAPWWAL